jgi:hypothetical protein
MELIIIILQTVVKRIYRRIISFGSVSHFVFVMIEHALIRNDTVDFRAAQYW